MAQLWNSDGFDVIFLHDYVHEMMIGIWDHEYLKKQRVRFNVDVVISALDHAPKDVNDIFSYDHIVEGITKTSGAGHVLFVEQAAESVAAHVLQHSRVRQVRVRVEKLDIYPGSVGVEIVRLKA